MGFLDKLRKKKDEERPQQKQQQPPQPPQTQGSDLGANEERPRRIKRYTSEGKPVYE